MLCWMGLLITGFMPQNQVFLEKMRLCLIFLNKKIPFRGFIDYLSAFFVVFFTVFFGSDLLSDLTALFFVVVDFVAFSFVVADLVDFFFGFSAKFAAFHSSNFSSNTLPIGLGSPVNKVCKPLFSMI